LGTSGRVVQQVSARPDFPNSIESKSSFKAVLADFRADFSPQTLPLLLEGAALWVEPLSKLFPAFGLGENFARIKKMGASGLKTDWLVEFAVANGVTRALSVRRDAVVM